MKKLLVILMVLAFVAPAMADDALDASGSMRVEAYSISNRDFSDSDDQDQDFWDQRFRLQLRMKPADGVQATIRTDITEDTWGKYSNRPGGSSSSTTTKITDPITGLPVLDADGDPTYATTTTSNVNSTLMIDRAYLSVDKGIVNVTGGLSAYNLGMGHAFNNQGPGLQLTFKTPVSVRVGLVKDSENGSNSDQEDLGTEDTDSYFINLGFKNDALSANLFYATKMTGNDTDFAPTLIGAMVNTTLGPVAIKAELDIFGGSIDADTDAVGTQFYAQVDMKMSDQLKVGADLVYSSSNDDDGDSTKITAIDKFGDYIYQDRHSLSPGTFEPLSDDIFGQAVGANHTGSMGIGPYVYFTAMEGLLIKANIMFLSSADDLDAIDSILIYGVAAKWAMAPKTNLEVGYHAMDISEADDALETETYTGFGAVLTVSF